MTRFCPVCGVKNDAAALRCPCGRVFTEDIVATQSRVSAELAYERRKQIVKKAGILVSGVVVFLLLAAYWGGVFRTDVESGAEDKRTTLVAEAPPVAPPVALDPVFPQANVPYKATRAITGSTFAVADHNGQERRVTLLGIRTPKLDENFGVASKENLWALVGNKQLLVKLRKYTKEVDTIAEVITDGSNVALDQLRSGLAVVATADLFGLPEAEQQQYLLAAESAKTGKYGLWSGTRPPELASLEPAARAADRATGEPADPFPGELKRRGPRNQPAGMAFDGTNDGYEPAPRVNPPVPEPAQQKAEATALDLPPKEAPPRETATLVATPPSSGRKYTRGPFGGCFYINSNGNKSYVDRSKCE